MAELKAAAVVFGYTNQQYHWAHIINKHAKLVRRKLINNRKENDSARSINLGLIAPLNSNQSTLQRQGYQSLEVQTEYKE